MADLNGKIAIVVGASSGMGEATAKTYIEAGAKVVLAARSGDKLAALAAQLGPNALAYPIDARDPEATRALVEKTLEVFGQVDILAYVTGTNIPERSLEVLTAETWEMMLGTNLSGAFHCTQAVLPAMRQQGAGLIIYVSSGCVQKPDASGVSYQATKHGMVGLAHGTFQEEKSHGVRTCVIFPGLTDTPLVLKRPVPTPPEVVAQALQPQDVADACLFVAALPARAYVPELVLLPAGLS
jgi:serine 3-dehydrogenase (NADP+)